MSWQRPTALMNAIVAFLAGSAIQFGTQPTVVDRQSGVAFPAVLIPSGGSLAHQLTGTATRERTVFRVKVYAYGLYVDADAARAHLARFVNQLAPALARDREFSQRLLEMRIPMTLRLVTTRDLPEDAMAEAFDEALAPRVDRAAKELKMPERQTSLERFRGYLNLRELPVGSEIVFSCGPDGRVSVRVGAQAKPQIESPALCWALFDAYLGDKPISSDGRSRLIAGLPALLADVR